MKEFISDLREFLILPIIINLAISIWRSNRVMEQLEEQPEILDIWYQKVGFHLNLYTLIGIDFIGNMIMFALVMLVFLGLVRLLIFR